VGDANGEMYRLADAVTVRLVEAAPVAGALRFEVLSEGRRDATARILAKGHRPKSARRSRRQEGAKAGARGADRKRKRPPRPGRVLRKNRRHPPCPPRLLRTERACRGDRFGTRSGAGFVVVARSATGAGCSVPSSRSRIVARPVAKPFITTAPTTRPPISS